MMSYCLKSAILPYPPTVGTPVGGDRSNFTQIFGTRTLEFLSYRGEFCVNRYLASLTQYCGVTDTHTDTHRHDNIIGLYHASMALRGKNDTKQKFNNVLSKSVFEQFKGNNKGQICT